MRASRILRLRGKLEEEGLDALVVSSLPDIRYLSGFSGSNALCIVTRHRTFFLTDSRYALQCRMEVKGFRRFVTPLGLLDRAAELGLLRGCRKTGFASDDLTFARYRILRRLFPRTRFRPTTGIVEELAIVKDRREIAAIEKAVAISDKVFRALLPLVRPGVREIDLAAEISYLHRRNGAERDAFDSIVASGERGALPHARATPKKIRRGELVTLDFGCVWQGYGSDITRTVAVGKVPRRAREMYRVVLEAQRESIAAARPGMRARELDAVARGSIRKAGYGRYFRHGLGHGLGLHPHGRPLVSWRSEEVLQAGSVFTIEPGVYIPGYGGVRIEDDVLLTGEGCRVLTKASKEFTTVGS